MVPLIVPPPFSNIDFFHVHNILQLSMYHCMTYNKYNQTVVSRGGSRAGCASPPPPKIGKNKIFWRKIVIFHTKYPKIFRASLR